MKLNQIHKDIDKSEISELIIPNHTKIYKDKLIVKNYPNLNNLSCKFSNLKTFYIDCPSLSILNLSNNDLEKINLIGVPNLKTCIIKNNKINELDVLHLMNLETLSCSNNNLKELNCSNLLNLKKLNCSGNCLDRFNINGCLQLKSLKIDKDNTKQIEFFDFPMLKELSIRQKDFSDNDKNIDEGVVNELRKNNETLEQKLLEKNEQLKKLSTYLKKVLEINDVELVSQIEVIEYAK